MTDKEEYLKLFREQLDRYVINDMMNIAKRLINSGAIDFDLFLEHGEHLPYVLIPVVAREISDKYMPKRGFWRKFVNNLRHF